MRYEQARPLVNTLMEIAVLNHASPSLLREKIYKALDEFLPDMDEGCRERGCIAVDDFKETTNVAIPTIPQPEGQGKQNPEVQPRQP
jgi:hypothetical protein